MRGVEIMTRTMGRIWRISGWRCVFDYEVWPAPMTSMRRSLSNDYRFALCFERESAVQKRGQLKRYNPVPTTTPSIGGTRPLNRKKPGESGPKSWLG